MYVEEDKSSYASIDELSIDDDYDDRYVSTNSLKDIQDRIYIHQDINTRDAMLKIINCIRQMQSEWKGSELSARVWSKVYINYLSWL